MRAAKFGFTATEYERAKANYMSALEKKYTNRDKINNDVFGRACASNYLEKEPLLSIEQTYQIMQQLTPMLPVDVVNEAMKQLISLSDSNVVIYNTTTEKEGMVYSTEASFQTAHLSMLIKSLWKLTVSFFSTRLNLIQKSEATMRADFLR